MFVKFQPLAASATLWDLVIFGSGWAALAAALEAPAHWQTLLISREGALPLESAWAFASAVGESTHPAWKQWRGQLERHGGWREGTVDGAIAEVVANELLQAKPGLHRLYYGAPVAWAGEGGLWLGSKSGLHRIRSARWLDASETAELARLYDPAWQPAPPQYQTISLFCRHLPDAPPPSFEQRTGEFALATRPSLWRNETILSMTLPGGYPNPRLAWLPALRGWRAGGIPENGVISHGSLIPYRVYPRGAAPSLPGCIVACGAAVTGSATLAVRFEDGIKALEMLKAATPARTLGGEGAPARWDFPEIAADVGIAGLGTGGALAALAARRTVGGPVVALEALPFAGGIGTGGGIHYYYFGIKGGLQAQVDERMRQWMPLFGKPSQIRGFHPDAKKLALEALLEEAGVVRLHGALLFDVEAEGRTVRSALLTTPEGPRRLTATAWVDATGDGDVAARAGAAFQSGRAGDALTLPYSQSAGSMLLRKGQPSMDFVNFGAGYCEGTDVEDLTRARIAGVNHYLEPRYDEQTRPTYIAPLLGVRQSRHIETLHTLSFEELLLRARFADCVGYTGGHYDNHARDFEFESDQAAFWMWVCREFTGRVACEIPYRVILPVALGNLLLGCRAAGVSEEAHHAFRMQRDIQRLGEVAGTAASLLVRHGGEACSLPLDELRAVLAQSGALHLVDRDDPGYGDTATAAFFEYHPGSLADLLEALKGEKPSAALWHLWRAGEAAHPAVCALLDSPDPHIRWRAANLLAVQGDERGEPRLLEAIFEREIGQREREIKTEHEVYWSFVPRWYVALRFLRCCATPACLPALEAVAADAAAVLNVRSMVALVCERLATHPELSPGDKARMETLLGRLLAPPIPLARRGIREPLSTAYREGNPGPPPGQRPRAVEDYHWQLHLAIGRARKALGLALQAAGVPFLSDPRAPVRQSFARWFSLKPSHL